MGSAYYGKHFYRFRLRSFHCINGNDFFSNQSFLLSYKKTHLNEFANLASPAAFKLSEISNMKSGMKCEVSSSNSQDYLFVFEICRIRAPLALISHFGKTIKCVFVTKTIKNNDEDVKFLYGIIFQV